MNGKTMLLALSAVAAAMLALPVVAAATPAHISGTETFSVRGGTAAVLETTSGEKVTCNKGLAGSGSFESTTTGSITLYLRECVTVVFGFSVACTTHPEPAGTIKTTLLPVHLIMIAANSPGVLLTPNATGSFAHFTCAGVDTTITGNGIIGTITSPACGSASTTFNLLFQANATGLQKHTSYTSANYHPMLGSNKTALVAVHTLHFPTPKTLTCTQP